MYRTIENVLWTMEDIKEADAADGKNELMFLLILHQNTQLVALALYYYYQVIKGANSVTDSNTNNPDDSGLHVYNV